MKKEDLKKLLTDTTEIDPWLVSNFWQPLIAVLDTAESLYPNPQPPQRYLEARTFSQRLWEYCDEDDMRLLVTESSEGAGQFFHMMPRLTLARMQTHLTTGRSIQPTSDKPFSAVAAMALD